MADTKKTSGSLVLQWLNSWRKTPVPGQDQAEDNTKVEHKLELKEDSNNEKSKPLAKVLLCIYGVFTIATALLAVALIAVSTLSAVAASAMDAQDDSGRLVALVVLAVTAAITIAMAVYALIAVCSKKIRAIFVAAVVVIVLAVIQTIIAGASVRVTPKDADHLQRSLKDAFDMAARQHSPRHIKMWTTTQSNLRCCGFQSPYDYFHNGIETPDIPVSCCPTYDPDKSDLLQEKERLICKARKEFFEQGCSGEVLLVIAETAMWVFHVAIILIVLEIITAILGLLVVRTRKQLAEDRQPEHKDDKEAK